MKKIIINTVCVLLIAVSFMFAEYRFIMHNLIPCTTDTENIISIEIFGIVDEYYINNNHT